MVLFTNGVLYIQAYIADKLLVYYSIYPFFLPLVVFRNMKYYDMVGSFY